jgi:hypothetical protein
MYQLFCHILMRIEFSRQIFEKYSNIKLHENPSSGSGVFPCGRTDEQTDMTKLIVASQNSANAPNNFGDLLPLLMLRQERRLIFQYRDTKNYHTVQQPVQPKS